MQSKFKHNIELITSADGSHTLYVPHLNEHYHSVNGAKNESMHVFIEAGLNKCTKDNIAILEIGFGTGLNAFLSYLHKGPKTIHYTGLEKYPVQINLAQQLNFYNGDTEKKLLHRIHELSWNQKHKLSNTFYIHKNEVDVLTHVLVGKYDVVYFDAFAPDKQIEMWSKEVFQKIFDAMNPNGILTTYCAKGAVRRTMQACGFIVERLPGPKGKREMLRAIKPEK